MMENQNISNNEEWKNNNNSAGLLSRMASGDGHGEESPYFDGWKAYEVDPFHPIDNPLGVIQMGLAENQLCFDLVKDWILKNPGASMCTPEGVDAFQETAIFQDYHGLSKFRTAVASFMEKVRGNTVKFDPDRIVLSGGATGAHEIMGFCLANPGDAFLVPTPYYPGFDRDICWRTGIKLLPIKTHSYNNFKITNSALQDAYNKAQQSHVKVKGILITNPSNPLGTILDKETLHLLITFANTYQIHLICDEIYSATVFSDKPNPFISIAQIIDQQPINPNLIHIVYSLSKDMGFPGLRVGIIYSYNDHLVKSARRMSSFNLISSQTQLLLSSMLSDTPFITHYLDETKNRLANRFNTFTSSLSQIGIPCSNSNAGLFLWMDLHNLLTDQTFEAEIHLWRTIVHQVKLNVSPGSSFHCSEPGWFRVCFANMDDHTVQVALRRIKMFVARRNHHVSKDAVVVEEKRPVGKRKCWQTNLQLRLSARRMDEVMMSPHSPMPLSPLVKATT